MLSSSPVYCANRYKGSRPATIGSILVDRKKNMTSVHLRTGRMDRAYAAGIARTSTRIVEITLAVSELSNDGQGLAPPPAPKKLRYPSRVSGAARDGGFVAASASLWKEVSTIHSTGSTNRNPITQAARARANPP